MNITDTALEKLVHFTKENDLVHIRIGQINVGGGCGAKTCFGLLPEETVEDEDEVFAVHGISFVMDAALKETLGPLTIDFDLEKGLTVTAQNK